MLKSSDVQKQWVHTSYSSLIRMMIFLLLRDTIDYTTRSHCDKAYNLIVMTRRNLLLFC